MSSFALPLGSTVNMDGTALYECVAVNVFSDTCAAVIVGKSEGEVFAVRDQES